MDSTYGYGVILTISFQHHQIMKEKIIEYLKENKYVTAMIVLTLFLILIKYILTGCHVVCMDWYDDTLYLDPIQNEETPRLG